MIYGILADLIVGFHLLYVAFVILGQLVISLGVLLGWGWARNPWFRWTHLLMMWYVGIEGVFNVVCPLTKLENYLRALAGQEAADVSFLGRMLQSVLFVPWSVWFVNALHVGFAVLVIATFLFAPPRIQRSRWAFALGVTIALAVFPLASAQVWVFAPLVVVCAVLAAILSAGLEMEKYHGTLGGPGRAFVAVAMLWPICFPCHIVQVLKRRDGELAHR
jgi:Protein of Unknown function (DUF2784)